MIDYITTEQAHHLKPSAFKGKLHYKGFNSLDHVQQYLKDPTTKFWSHKRSSLKDDASFAGTRNIEEAFDLMEKGWPEGTNKLNDIDVTNSQFNIGKVNQLELNVAGYMPDVPTYLSGNPMCMYSRGPDFHPKKQYEIVVQTGYAWFVKSKQLFNYGTAVLKVVDNLEQQGHRVRVVAVNYGSSGGYDQYHEVCLKDYADPFDINQLAFAICHTSFLRRICFALTESETDYGFGKAYCHGYGCAVPLKPKFYADGAQRIIFAGLGHREADTFNTLEGAMGITEKLLIENGVEDIQFMKAA